MAAWWSVPDYGGSDGCVVVCENEERYLPCAVAICLAMFDDLFVIVFLLYEKVCRPAHRPI